MKQRRAIALGFSAVGIVAVGGVWFLTALAQGLSGLGSGASTGGYISVPLVVIPIAIYFASGVVAALSQSRPTRLVCAAVAHLMPFAALLGLGRDWTYVAILEGAIFAAFALAWFRLLALRSPRDQEA